MSKPALLKKGLRQYDFSNFFITDFSSRNLPYLKRDCDLLNIFSLVFSIQLSKPALLKKGLRHPILDPISHTTPPCRNLPYLKRDCDTTNTANLAAPHSKSRNLPYLKRDCDKENFLKFNLLTSISVETCPT
jgi:hypothetical protein